MLCVCGRGSRDTEREREREREREGKVTVSCMSTVDPTSQLKLIGTGVWGPMITGTKRKTNPTPHTLDSLPFCVALLDLLCFSPISNLASAVHHLHCTHFHHSALNYCNNVGLVQIIQDLFSLKNWVRVL